MKQESVHIYAVNKLFKFIFMQLTILPTIWSLVKILPTLWNFVRNLPAKWILMQILPTL